METTKKLIDGTKIQMAGEEFTVPPLTLGSLRRLMPKIEKLTSNIDISQMSDDMIDAIGDIICTAMQRNYPEMTAEKVVDMIDMSNMPVVMGAVLGASGLVKGAKQSGEAASQ